MNERPTKTIETPETNLKLDIKLWINGKEAALLSGDRRMVVDDGVSPRLTLNKGRNILRGVVINGPGMSDFCVRFLDENGQPIRNVTVSCE